MFVDWFPIHRPSPSMVVALIALVIAVSGTAVAATRLVNGDKLIKKATLSGNRLRNHSITGTQVNLTALGKVPSASNADTATNAIDATNAGTAMNATNANHAASADTTTNATKAGSSNNGAQRIDFVTTVNTDPAPSGPTSPGAHTVLSLDELTVTASCINAGGGNDRVYVAFGSSSAADLSYEGAQFNNPGTVTVMDGTQLGSITPAFRVADLTGGNRDTTLEVVYRNASRTITANLTAAAETFASPGCEVEGTAVAAPS